jgi:hypothetical protein
MQGGLDDSRGLPRFKGHLHCPGLQGGCAGRNGFAALIGAFAVLTYLHAVQGQKHAQGFVHKLLRRPELRRQGRGLLPTGCRSAGHSAARNYLGRNRPRSACSGPCLLCCGLSLAFAVLQRLAF